MESYLADYALQVAVQMEQLGHTFYESLAAGAGNAQVSALAYKLATDEIRHLNTFEDMRNSLPADQRAPKMTEDQIAAAAAKFHKLILPSAQDVHQVAIGGDILKALEMAMKMESDSIAYYSSLISTVGKGVSVLKAVIKEENKHLDSIRVYRKQLVG
jgi:rubrerythrin